MDVLVGEFASVPAAAFVGGKVDEFRVGSVGGGGGFRRNFNGDDKTAEVENLIEVKAAEAGVAPTHAAVRRDEDLMRMRGRGGRGGKGGESNED